MAHVHAIDLKPGDTYTIGDPTDPANTVTVTDTPRDDKLRTIGGHTIDIIRVPIRTHDGTHLHDTVLPGATITTNQQETP